MQNYYSILWYKWNFYSLSGHDILRLSPAKKAPGLEGQAPIHMLPAARLGALGVVAVRLLNESFVLAHA